MRREISLDFEQIHIVIDKDGRGSISSTLREGTDLATNNVEFDEAMDKVEELVLVHACSGVDVASEAYVNGIAAIVHEAERSLL